MCTFFASVGEVDSILTYIFSVFMFPRQFSIIWVYRIFLFFHPLFKARNPTIQIAATKQHLSSLLFYGSCIFTLEQKLKFVKGRGFPSSWWIQKALLNVPSPLSCFMRSSSSCSSSYRTFDNTSKISRVLEFSTLIISKAKLLSNFDRVHSWYSLFMSTPSLQACGIWRETCAVSTTNNTAGSSWKSPTGRLWQFYAWTPVFLAASEETSLTYRRLACLAVRLEQGVAE